MCTYVVTWKPFTSPWSPYIAGTTGAALSAAAVAMSGGSTRDGHRSWDWALALGGVIGALSNR